MMQFRRSRIAGFAAAMLLASCAGHAIPQSSEAIAPVFAAKTASSCKGQVNTDKYSYVSEEMFVKGGSLCIPTFAGWGGTLAYPKMTSKSNNGVLVGSSTTDYNGILKLPERGKPLFYLQLTYGSFGSLGKTLSSNGALYGPALKEHQPYTFFGAELGSGSTAKKYSPCYTIAAKGAYGVEVSRVGSVLENASLVPENSVIEVFKGKRTKTRC
jgi:hypothetical protein